MNNRFANLLHRQQELYWSDETKTASWRRRQLGLMKQMLIDNREAWCEAIHADYGKPSFEQAFEVMVPTGVIENYLSRLDEYMAPEERELPKGLADMGYRGVIYREPFGPTLVIGPFNAPLLLVIDPAIAALAAGNPVVLKPSNSTPVVAALFERLVPKYFEPSAVTVVNGGHEEIGELLKLPFDFIFFTGSSKVGKVVMRSAAEHLTPVILELGGQILRSLTPPPISILPQSALLGATSPCRDNGASRRAMSALSAVLPTISLRALNRRLSGCTATIRRRAPISHA